jgi:hypothetical protein
MYATSLTSISGNLFRNNTDATDFGGAFYEATSLTSIPSDLFRNNTRATTFYFTFTRIAITSIPSGLFRNNTNITDCAGIFAEVPNLTSIPDDLFSNNNEVTRFSFVFSGSKKLSCSRIAEASAYWDRWNANGVDMKEATKDCKSN